MTDKKIKIETSDDNDDDKYIITFLNQTDCTVQPNQTFWGFLVEHRGESKMFAVSVINI